MTKYNAPNALALEPEDIETWIFDLDNTLYRTTPEMLAQIDTLMGSFISNFLNVDLKEARQIQKTYFRAHGLTLRGLMLEHGLDPQVYIDHLSQLDLSDIVKNPELCSCIAALPGRKIIYTNAFTNHAHDVMARIGLTPYFDAVFDISDAAFIPKPAIESYRCLCERHDIDPSRAAMVEDIARNLEPASELGMTTIWVRTDMRWAKDITSAEYIDYTTDNLTLWLTNLANYS